jgi:hypothetical protein
MHAKSRGDSCSCTNPKVSICSNIIVRTVRMPRQKKGRLDKNVSVSLNAIIEQIFGATEKDFLKSVSLYLCAGNMCSNKENGLQK